MDRIQDNNMNLLVKTVEEKHLEAICDLVENKEILFLAFPSCSFPLTIKQLQNKLNERFENTVFSLGNKIIGYSNLYYYNNEKEPYIGNVILDKNYRGKGYGKMILNTMIQKALKYNTCVKLDVINENKKAYNLYNSLGFKPFNTGNIKDYNDIDRTITFMKLDKT